MLNRGEDARRLREALHDPWELVEALGLVGADSRRGRDYRRLARGVLVRCPAHGDGTPSCSVTVGGDGSVRVKCFGCELSGSGLDLIAAVLGADTRGPSFGAVLERAASIAGEAFDAGPGGRVLLPSAGPRPAPPPPAPSAPELPPGTFEAIAGVLQGQGRMVCDLGRGDDVRAYLDARGLVGPCAGWFGLPGGARDLDALRDRIVDAIGAETWLATGLASTREGPHRGRWRRWEHRLLIPWRGADGTVDVFQQRLLRDKRKGDRWGKYEFPPERAPSWPYGWPDVLEHGPEIVALVEGAIDAVAFSALARRHGADALALGLPGAQGWRLRWANALAGRRVVFGFDADAAGARGVSAVREDLRRAGVAVDADQVPIEGKDWGEAWARTTRAA